MVVEIEMEAYNANTSPLFTHEKLSSNTYEGFLKKNADKGPL
jgi:hypothetical protein